MVVFLLGKTGELKQNVHFIAGWPAGGSLTLHYSPGERYFDQVALRQTVTLIQRAQIAIYCDELMREGSHYQYAGAERNRTIRYCLDKRLKITSGYRPFKKGLFSDDQRAIWFSFDGLHFLPPGSLTVTVKRGEASTTLRQRFPLWRAGTAQWIELKEIGWDPTEWTAELQFDDTSERYLKRWR